MKNDLPSVVTIGYGSEYIFSDVVSMLREAGFRCIELDMMQRGWRSALAEAQALTTSVVLTSQHPLLDAVRFKRHYHVEADVLNLGEVLAAVKPIRSYFVPHDLQVPIYEEEVFALRQVTGALMPDDRFWYLRRFTDVHEIGWVKDLRTVSEVTLPEHEYVFLPSEIAAYCSLSVREISERLRPMLQMQVPFKLPAWPGVELLKNILVEAGCPEIAPEISTTTVIKFYNTIVSTGTSSVLTEAAWQGKNGLCLADGTVSLELQILAFANYPTIRIMAPEQVTRAENAQSTPNETTPKRPPFDFDLLVKIIAGETKRVETFSGLSTKRTPSLTTTYSQVANVRPPFRSTKPLPSVPEGTCVFTIAARNFIAQVITLRDSLLEHNPGITFYLALCDEDKGVDHDALPFEIITLSDLEDDRVWGMAERYNVTEFCTAIKPMVFNFLMDRHPDAAICYFDPDIFVVSEMTELWNAFRAGGQVMLTPHVLVPSLRPELFPDETVLKFGIYNLGFLGIRDTDQTRALMSWWSDVLETKCIIDLPNGLFVDQKWADLIPALVDHVVILRHPGYNVAYWNMLQRPVTFAQGDWKAAGEPLRFMHFSGHEITKPSVFSRHGWFLDKWVIGDLRHLLALYRQKVLDAGFLDYAKFVYSFNWGGSANINLHTPQAVSETLALERSRIGRGLAAFVGASAEPAAGPDPATKIDDLWSVSVSSFEEFQRLKPKIDQVMEDGRSRELDLIPHEVSHFLLDGTCSMCRTRSTFSVGDMYAAAKLEDGRFLPNWREHLDCTACGFTNRIRAAMHYLQTGIRPPSFADIYITEQVTDLFKWLKIRWPNLVGSEYFSPKHLSGRSYDGVRHEDLCSVTFSDESFDVVMSFDVLEHVEDFGRAIGECYRILRPGGTLFFAAPTQYNDRKILDRVLVNNDGSYDYILEPEYHGNPVNSEEGALCFRYLGLSILEQLKAIGFVNAQNIIYRSDEYRYLGPYQNFFVARRAPREQIEQS